MDPHQQLDIEESTHDGLADYLAATPPAPPQRYIELYRVALAQWRWLTRDTLDPVMRRLQGTCDQALTQATREYEKKRSAVENGYLKQIDQYRNDHDRQLADRRQEHQSQRQQLEQDLQRQISRLSSTADARLRDARQTSQYDQLTAETVAEAARKKCRAQRDRLNAALPATIRQFTDLLEEAIERLKAYRFSNQVASLQQRVDPQALPPDTPVNRHADVDFQENLQQSTDAVAQLERMFLPRLFVGATPWLLLTIVPLLCAAVAFFIGRAGGLETLILYYVAGGSLLSTIVLLWGLGRLARLLSARRIILLTDRIATAIQQGLQRTQLYFHTQQVQLDEQVLQVENTYRDDVQAARDLCSQTEQKLSAALGQSSEQLQQQARDQFDQLDRDFQQHGEQAQQEYQDRQARLCDQRDTELNAMRRTHHEQTDASRKTFEQTLERLRTYWHARLALITQLMEQTRTVDEPFLSQWDQVDWESCPGALHSCSLIRMGTLTLPGQDLFDQVQALADASLRQSFSLPAVFDRTHFHGLVAETDHADRDAAIQLLRAVMTRLLLSQPPGRVRFVILDPIGLGESFAGFMHAADYREELVGRRIWTGAEQIQQQMTDLTEHMENVIQKYLRNEYPSIEAYNERAGELAEPYRYLVIADFPSQFNEESARRLTSIIQNGARCGVYPLIAFDRRQAMPLGISREELFKDVVHLRLQNGVACWQDPDFCRFDLQLDASPAEEDLTRCMHALGQAAQGNLRVEVSFDALSPGPEQTWSLDSRREVRLPLGRSGATRLQYMTLGKGLSQHVLIAGKTGSGKSTLMHVMITAACLWYDPDELELYLVDFKKGVEFKSYTRASLPHLRTVAIESDREFGLSVLQRLNEELTRRGELFRAAGMQDIAAYRDKTDARLPRTLLIVDEFQVFFTEDDKLAHDAGVLLEQLVRQGRAFGIHVILGSQTLAGVSALARSTTGQMAVRIALQCAESDSQLILDEDNLAARLLSRPGEAIYNDAGGMLAGNNPFQVSWISDFQRDELLAGLSERTADPRFADRQTLVFEGNAPAQLTQNACFTAALNGNHAAAEKPAPLWLGEPVAIKQPTSVSFRRQSGDNLLIVGQNEQGSLGLVQSLLLSLAAQVDRRDYRVVVIDGSPMDSSTALELQRLLEMLPESTRPVPWRDVEQELGDLASQVQQRLEGSAGQDGIAATTLLVVFSLQHLRMLRRQEETFSFSWSGDEEEKAVPGWQQLAEIIKDGPTAGVHTVLCADTLASVERVLERPSLREFENRVLFQMSESDSSNLIDTPVANRLGPFRALLYREARGQLEKFRPYAALEAAELNRLTGNLKRPQD